MSRIWMSRLVVPLVLGLLLAAAGCNLSTTSTSDQFETQVAETVRAAENATGTVRALGTQIAATVAHENELTATAAAEPLSPTPTAEPPTEEPTRTALPTNTVPPAPTNTPPPTHTATPTAKPTPRVFNRSVTEALGVNQTGIFVYPGEKAEFFGSGSIWSGVALTGENGPWGWDETDCDPKFPLPCAHPYSLLVKIGNMKYWEMGTYVTISYTFTHDSPGEIILAINDDSPGNGSGEFNVEIIISQ